MGVRSRIMVPMKKFELTFRPVRLSAITAVVPVSAIAIPRVCFGVRCSLSIRAERVVMRIGESRQTSIEAIEAFASWIPVYWIVKKKVTPVSARKMRLGMSVLCTRRVWLGLRSLLIASVARNIRLARRKRKVAIAVGVNPSWSVIFTMTKELPQKVMRSSIRRAFEGLMGLSAMRRVWSLQLKSVYVAHGWG